MAEDNGHRISDTEYRPNDGQQPVIVVRRRQEAVQILQFTAVFVAPIIALAFVTALVLTSSDWGRERVRRFVLGQTLGTPAPPPGWAPPQVPIGHVMGQFKVPPQPSPMVPQYWPPPVGVQVIFLQLGSPQTPATS